MAHGGERVIPASQTGGGSMNITITGNTFMSDREAAEKIGDIIFERVKMNLRT